MARSLRLALSDEDELKKRGYVVGALLGEGSYAKVKWALSKNLDKKVALKIISKKKAPLDFQQKFLPRELETMKLFNHPNIVKLHEVLYFKDKIVMVMEMAGHGDLLEYVKLRGALGEDKARRMFGQLLSAVEYMHSFNVVHRDLKCENVLLDVENNVKLSDFGFSRIQRPEQLSRTYCGSAAYASPEVLQGIPYNGKTYDVWSLGVILYIMICGSMPYDDSDVKKMIKYQTERKVGFSRHKKICQDAKDLIHSILEADVNRRFTVREIKHSAWMLIPPAAEPSQLSLLTAVTKSKSQDQTNSLIETSALATRIQPPPPETQPTVVADVEEQVGVSGSVRPETPLRTSTLLAFETFRTDDSPTITDSTRPLPVVGARVNDGHVASKRTLSPVVERVPNHSRDRARGHGR